MKIQGQAEQVTEQNYFASFDYLIGGLLINVNNDISSVQQQGGKEEFMRFIHPGSSPDADIQVSMECTSRKDDTITGGDAIFSGNNCKFLAREDAFQFLRFWGEEQEKPFLVVQTDSLFSVFHYRFQQDAAKIHPIDPYRSAAESLLLQHSFINHKGIIIHAGGGSVQGKGIVFAGTSGAGKSTLSELLSASPDNRLYSDERLVIRFVDEQWNLWGTPWQGTGNIARNETSPLSALVFLRQAEKTQITELSPSAGLHRLLQVVSIPWYSAEWTNKGLAVCESLIQDIPMFELAFRPDQTAVDAVEEWAMKLS
ncbi:MAG: hypothetical protein D3904_08210 [Candidatus Electrothrix sp. EH2]|nr:hypothetical protein [Candidatus Electrothrix sp. EH2]